MRLTQQIVVLALVSVLTSATAIVFTASRSVSTEMTRQQSRLTQGIIDRLTDQIFVGRVTSSATKDNDAITGVKTADLSNIRDNAVDDSARIAGGAATIFMFDSASGKFIRSRTSIRDEQGKRAVGTALADDSPAQAVIRRSETYCGETVLFGKRYYAIYKPTLGVDGKINGIIFAGSPMDDLYYASYYNIMFQLSVVTVILASIIAIAVGILANRIFSPLRAISKRVERLAQGDMASTVPETARRDEVGLLAKAIESFREGAIVTNQLRESQEETRHQAEADRARREVEAKESVRLSDIAVQELGSGLGHLANGNLIYRIDSPLYPAAERLRIDLNEASNRLRETMTDVAERAESIGHSAIEVTTASDDLARRTEEQAANLREAASGLEQITGAIKITADRAVQARLIVVNAKVSTSKSEEIVREAVDAMVKIERSSLQVGQIISVIDEIAFQTSLLALNAGVEAARAGEAGRGFAVVAAEVGTLAQRSAEAAKEIKGIIAQSSTQVNHGVELVGETGRSLAEIMTKVAELDSIIDTIADNAQEQSKGLREINTVVGSVDGITQRNAAMVQQSTAVSHALRSEAEALSDLIGHFQIGFDRTKQPKATGFPSRMPKPAKPRYA